MKARNLLGMALLLILGVALLTAAGLDATFFSLSNLGNVLLQAAIIGIVAVGMTPVIVAGRIDLSVGAVVALAGVVLALANGAGCPPFLAFVIALSVAALCGAVNGVAIARFGVPSFIATL